MTRNDRPIAEVKLRYSIQSGIEIPSRLGIIPLLYEMQACDAANYRFFHDWKELSRQERAIIVAKHVISQLIDSHREDAVARDIDRKSKKGG